MTSHSVPLAGVFGWPIAHSLSPLLHGHWLQATGIKGHYVPLECKPEDLASAVPALLKTGFRGFNVTAPHKESIFAFADHVTQRAKIIGAVNTLWRDGGKLYGDTTDGDGFLASLPDGCDLSHCVIIGAGGASKAIAYALCDTRALKSLTLLNRTQQRAAAVLETLQPCFPTVEMHTQTLDQGANALSCATLLINCTSLGMTGQPPLEMDLSPCADDMVLYDTVYSPAQTPLMRAGIARGLQTVGGLGMLIEQGRPGFAHWFGALAPVTGEEQALLKRALGQAQ